MTRFKERITKDTMIPLPYVLLDDLEGVMAKGGGGWHLVRVMDQKTDGIMAVDYGMSGREVETGDFMRQAVRIDDWTAGREVWLGILAGRRFYNPVLYGVEFIGDFGRMLKERS